jgi:hypothetical protein
MADMPKEIMHLISFLERSGLALEYKLGPDEANFGNLVLIYRNENAGVQILSDRAQWFFDIGDPADGRQEWFDFHFLRKTLPGGDEEEPSLARQVELMTANWPMILMRLGADQKKHTREMVDILGQEAVKRRGW